MAELREDPQVWHEFRRRRVVRVVIAYVAASFAVLELAALGLPLTDAPAWGHRAVVGALALGFPFTVVLAWTYDITPTGIVKTPDQLEAPAELTPDPSRGWLVITWAALVLGALLELIRR